MPSRNDEKVPLGRTKLMVSKICFGTSALGSMPDTYGYEVEENRAKQTVQAILAGPVNFLDTSRNYGFGRSEQRIGSVIRENGGLPNGTHHLHQTRSRPRDQSLRWIPGPTIIGGKP